jgi:transposase
LDLSELRASYTEVRGAPPFDPRLMLKLLIYGYATGVCSSRKIEQRGHDDVGCTRSAGQSGYAAQEPARST